MKNILVMLSKMKCCSGLNPSWKGIMLLHSEPVESAGQVRQIRPGFITSCTKQILNIKTD